uniref:DNA fragmentation factor subunit beta n=1 Tax=Neogobius melanostomus TaxID=47308 RepID=A0A8C6UCZ8_9GOBI
MFGLFGKTKAVKVRAVSDSRRFGVAAQSLKELIRKACDFLKVPVGGAHVCLSSDGTLVTEGLFGTLPEHCELVLLSRGQSWKGVVSDLERLLTSEHRDQLVEAVSSLLSDPLSPQRHKLLRDMQRTLEDTSERETRDQDQDWFTGLDTRFKTKSSYMRFNCESRIRSYMKEVLLLFLFIQDLGGRGSRLCTAEGWFTCQGSFDEALCPSLHSINPYSSRENRVIFSTWNLDHRIEKKRSVIPALLECHQNRTSADINLTYFYSLLFTTDNLKLVHIACHKKGAHNLQCDAKKVYKRTVQTGKQQRGKKRRLR